MAINMSELSYRGDRAVANKALCVPNSQMFASVSAKLKTNLCFNGRYGTKQNVLSKHRTVSCPRSGSMQTIV